MLASIGGNHSNQLLPLLDFELIREHPKIFQGYSDMTVLHWAIATARRVSAPSTGRRSSPSSASSRRSSRTPAATCAPRGSAASRSRYEPSADLDRRVPRLEHAAPISTRAARATPERGLGDDPGAEQLRGRSSAAVSRRSAGISRDRRAWIDPGGAILLLETSEEAPPPALRRQRTSPTSSSSASSTRAAALVVARPYGYAADQSERLWEVIAKRTEASGLPVLANVEAGHTDPMITLPFGVPAELDATRKTLRLHESPTEARA